MINSLRGMRDFLDNDGALYERVVGVCAKVAQNFGFAFIETPKLEETALFRRSVGESSDIVGKEMYEFSALRARLGLCEHFYKPSLIKLAA